MAAVRHLTMRFALSALGRGAGIEQFLGPFTQSGARGVRWVEIMPYQGRYLIFLTEVEDAGREGFWDVTEFPPLDPADESEGRRRLTVVDDPATAITAAKQLVGADDTRWVNRGMVGDEYLDYVRDGRPERGDSAGGEV